MRVAFLAWSSPFLRLLRFFAADPVWRTAGRLRIPEWKSRAVTGVSLAGNTCRLGNEVRGRKSEVGGRGCFQFSAFQLFSVCLATPTVVAGFHGEVVLQRRVLACLPTEAHGAKEGTSGEIDRPLRECRN